MKPIPGLPVYYVGQEPRANWIDYALAVLIGVILALALVEWWTT